jgi:putative ABC transport system permease protein
MLRNYISAAIGNIGRNGLYAGITILGLAVSFAAAILIGLYLRDEFSFERFIPGHERVYRAEINVDLPGAKPMAMDQTFANAAANLKLEFPEIERVARIQPGSSVLKVGDAAVQEGVIWADPGFFQVMPYPVLAGDVDAALDAPDGLVLTRQAARKYFGQDAPIGRVVMVDTGFELPGLAPDETQMMRTFHPMRVLAVLKDLPSNTHIRAQVFASARAPHSLVALDDRHSSPFNIQELTYLKLKPGASVDSVRARLPAFADHRYRLRPGASPIHFRLMPVTGLHFTATSQYEALSPKGDPRVDAGVAAEGVLVVLIAAINFVTLMTARAARRAVEVGVRKALGASRRDLIVQFMGEALIYVTVAMTMAAVLAELALPSLNAFLQRRLAFDYASDPSLLAAIVGAALLTVLLAGAYPALVLSAFRPATALKGSVAPSSGSAAVRQGLVVAQFAIVIGLILVTATIYRQTRFALHDALRLDTSQLVLIETPCRSAFHKELPALPGVQGASCAAFSALSTGFSSNEVIMPDNTQRTVSVGPVDVGFLELHGLKPVAGRFFSRARGEDMVLDREDAAPELQPTVVLNEGAARLLGFARPADAVGKTIKWMRWSAATDPNALPTARPSQVIGVTHDFTMGSIRTAISPSIYYVDPRASRVVVAKLDGGRMPETLKAIDDLWRRTGHDRPLSYEFESARVQALYQDVITQGAAIAVCAGLAVVIACLGLFALAAFVTERRTKEIGVRKAAGASTGDIVRLLLWQFTRPVLWASVIAWPAAFWVMNWWLHGFAYRVDLPPWLFLGGAAAAAVIAWATVSAQSWRAARARPATALRYE